MPLTNSIGAHTFYDLAGPIFYRQQQLEIIERPGVDGSGVRRLGSRGKPFDLVSVQYHADFSAAATALQAYDNLPGTNPVTLMRDSVNHGSYLVLEVLEIATEAVQTVVAVGIASTHTVRQVVRWRLLG